MRKNDFHILRKIRKVNVQDNFIFVDTESNINRINDSVQELTFKLGYAYFWNKNTNFTKGFGFYTTKHFWDNVERFFSKENRHIIMYAHNSQFDMKMLNGYNELLKRGWKIKNQYIKQSTYIINFTKKVGKNNYYLYVWDTLNYVKKSLEQIGKVLGFPKLKIDFSLCSDKELMVYCKRDTMILKRFIEYLINFLIENDLSKLKATAGAIALSSFRHRFYSDKKAKAIYIHNKEPAIRLERESYRGGITDVFKLGTNDNIYKLDINSMYPYVMANKYYPRKLVLYTNSCYETQETLLNIWNEYKKDHLFIVRAKITLPKESAYILNDFGKGKAMFGYGQFIVSLCQPEIEFVLSNGGTIDYIYALNMYEKSNLFKEYVLFFYEKRKQYRKEHNEVYSEFCKLMLNTLYGKFGQRDIEYKLIEQSDKWYDDNEYLIETMLKSKADLIKDNDIIYLGKIINECEVYLIRNEIWTLKQLKRNSYESFVAIASFITSNARMLLIDYLKISNRTNTYYADTDSLFCNQQAYENLLAHNCINEYELGKLKIEGIGKGTFYAPKFYDFIEQQHTGLFEVFLKERKCKGIKKNSKLIYDNSDKAIYEIELWNKFKSDLNNGNLSNQLITTKIKEINKIYDKGIIDKDGCVYPFSVDELLYQSV